MTVLGAGRVGRAVISDLCREHEVAVFDPAPGAAEGTPAAHRYACSPFERPSVIRRSELIVSTLPGSAAYRVIRRLLRTGKDVVDTSFMPEDPLLLDEAARKHGVLFIPDAGYAPGLTNVLAGRLFSQGCDEIRIYVGGLPLKPPEAFMHSVTFNAEGLIDEYLRPARIVRDGMEISLDPLSSFSELHLEGAGTFQSFYTDGLRTLLRTLKVREMFEKTLRYPGHLELMRSLRSLGFLSGDRVAGCVPRKLSEAVFERFRTAEDMCITAVEGHADVWHRYVNIDRYNPKASMSSMSRMTGYSASSMARIVLSGEIDETGVFPPEYFGLIEKLYYRYMGLLERKGITMHHETSASPL